MAVDEAARHQLYNSLESTLGPEPTSTLMSLLPPVGWADVATKQDLAVLRNDLRNELRVEVATLRSDMHQQTRDLTFRLIAAMVSLAAITWAAVTYGS